MASMISLASESRNWVEGDLGRWSVRGKSLSLVAFSQSSFFPLQRVVGEVGVLDGLQTDQNGVVISPVMVFGEDFDWGDVKGEGEVRVGKGEVDD